ncbi:TPA: AAA family ATPase [Legionella pneumophila]|nr:AAA family ATPase [Legionella pneumophila]HAT9133969.1 AAA family ATPase [Legionella pneumophila subsp. pneumophila]HAT9722376.1 AAA family ATPase [Legionella pneumophila subsp. pneumophila]HAU0937203.1 AAA family ATPase [Legionella pneumophila]HAU1689070.1 AAA family ATPase [Legionella pneumophila]
MIRIKKLLIHEFRGIRDLIINMNGDNFAVCGPNGTGKSGIVDSIEFALTGNVSRLAGQGTGNLSVKEHGPHVDCKDHENARVTLTFEIIATGKEASIQRTVKNIKKPKITPTDPDVIEVLSHIEAHPEFVLSRRELIKYVLSNPGDRAKEVQALLRLDKLESLRTNFQKIANTEKRNEKSFQDQVVRSKAALINALGVTQLSSKDVLEQINTRREVLDLPKIEKLEANTSFKEDLATTGDKASQSLIAKAQALIDIKTLNEKQEDLLAKDFITKHAAALEKVSALAADPLIDKAVLHKNMLDVALEIFNEEQCPVCDTEWEAENFRTLVQNKLNRLESLKKQQSDLENSVTPIATTIEALTDQIIIVAKYGSLLAKPINIQPVTQYQATLNQICIKLRNLFPLSDTESALAESFKPSQEFVTTLEEIKKAIEALPDPSIQDAAKEYLIVAQERMETYRSASIQLKVCQSRIAIADKVHNVYGDVMTTELENLYVSVEKNFRNLYRIINADDESAFEAKLTPSMGRLGFDVDFYGRGYFPPGAFHSEGHQDSMGLCLYLSLMQHLLSENFTFAVLDDVLMSVDAGHRREVCTLLKHKFPSTQFMLTTHDDIWLRHMKTAGLIKRNGFVHFRTWSVDVGPTEWDDRDVWREMDDHLAQNNVRDAAALLRHYLEYLAKEICHRLRAPVVFRGDAQYSLGDLLPPGVKRLRDFFKEGIKVAGSWNQTDKKAAIETLLQSLNDAANASEVEQWQINTAIHYNEWENLNKRDFEPVVEAFKNLNKVFECEICEELLYVSPERGKKEAVRCGCGSINVNLIGKS